MCLFQTLQDLEEVCWACRLTRVLEHSVGLGVSLSPSASIMASRLRPSTSPLLEALISQAISRLFDSSILDSKNDSELIFVATGKKG